MEGLSVNITVVAVLEPAAEVTERALSGVLLIQQNMPL